MKRSVKSSNTRFPERLRSAKRRVPRATATLIALLASCSVGCLEPNLPTVDIRDATFANQDDYEQYDRDSVEAAKGQAP